MKVEFFKKIGYIAGQEELMSERTRRYFSAEEKVKIIRLVLLEKQLVSAVCEEYKLQPSLYYLWQKQFFENGAAAFGKEKPTEDPQLLRQVQKLEQKVRQQQEVIAEVTGEYVQLKKELGVPSGAGKPDGPLASPGYA